MTTRPIVSWLIRRRQDRFASRFTVHYRHGDQISEGILTNVSRAGWCVHSREPVRVGDLLTFRLPFDAPDNPLSDVQTIVRWVRGEHFGVEIREQSPATQARVQTWVCLMSRAMEWARRP